MKKQTVIKSFNCECPYCGAHFWGRAKNIEYSSENISSDGKITHYIHLSKRYRCKLCKRYWEVVYRPVYRFGLIADGKGGARLDKNFRMEYFPSTEGTK